MDKLLERMSKERKNSTFSRCWKGGVECAREEYFAGTPPLPQVVHHTIIKNLIDLQSLGFIPILLENLKTGGFAFEHQYIGYHSIIVYKKEDEKEFQLILPNPEFRDMDQEDIKDWFLTVKANFENIYKAKIESFWIRKFFMMSVLSSFGYERSVTFFQGKSIVAEPRIVDEVFIQEQDLKFCFFTEEEKVEPKN